MIETTVRNISPILITIDRVIRERKWEDIENDRKIEEEELGRE
jgi:hypothetical protein